LGGLSGDVDNKFTLGTGMLDELVIEKKKHGTNFAGLE
jgi:hypothetical protein